MERFIICVPQLNVTEPPRFTEANYLYAKTIQESKWQSNTFREAAVSIINGDISILESPGTKDTGLLNRCIIGYFRKEVTERSTLADIRRWASALWNKAFGVNMYEMIGNLFLFEFSNRSMVEQILQVEWRWKKCKLHLEWWNPTVGCIPNSLTVKTKLD